jgi:hypothetical protein
LNKKKNFLTPDFFKNAFRYALIDVWHRRQGAAIVCCIVIAHSTTRVWSLFLCSFIQNQSREILSVFRFSISILRSPQFFFVQKEVW